MKEHAKSLRRKRIGRPRPVLRDRAVAGATKGREPERSHPRSSDRVCLQGRSPSVRLTVPPMAADATRLETRTTEPLVPGETTARETPVSQGSRRFLRKLPRSRSGDRSGIATDRIGCEASPVHRTR